MIAPAIGYEYWTAHRTLRVLAEMLATRGHGVLRFDYDGHGDSAGESWDSDRVTSWRQSIVHAVSVARATGVRDITLVGLRMGATLALTEAQAVGADRVVAWAPITSGKRYMKEMRMLGLSVPDSVARPVAEGTVIYAGTVVSPDTAADLAQINLEQMEPIPSARLLLVARTDHACDKLATHLVAGGGDVQLEELAGAETALDTPTEGATVPTEILDVITGWIGDASASAVAPTVPVPPTLAKLRWNGGEIIEEVLPLGELELIGVCGRPASAAENGTVVVFLNSGSEPHVGPGRCWVEYTRELNLHGYATVRLDFSGWGESPDLDHAPGRPYDEHCIAETLAVVAALRRAGHRRVVLAGLCAGAWVGMRAALQASVDAVIAINPQLYWKPGEPLDIRITDTAVRRTPIRRREARLGRWGLWSLLDAMGMTNYAGRWLARLVRDRTHVLLLFAEGDEGLVYLHNRLRRRLDRVLRAGTIELVQIPDIDHQMYRGWRRGEVVASMRIYLDALPDSA
ncbi:MAG TPA: alpha/beta hydrolase family protein [Rhodanobacter sp.]|nr:alpha/beta hydrolase family protein [Rhodanobacter sp.]